jgi:hypothetical protein
MNIPFTAEQLFYVFRNYNLAIWPTQIAAYLAAALALWSILGRSRSRDRIVPGVLGLMWLLNGAGYHIGFFTEINKAAYVFGGLFIIQGLWFLSYALRPGRIAFGRAWDAWSGTGAVMILYALFLYPVLGTLAGHGFPNAPMFGVAPCPTTIFTFGLLLTTRQGLPVRLTAIPFIWSMIGTMAALRFGVYEDFGLLAAGAIGVAALSIRERRVPASAAN